MSKFELKDRVLLANRCFWFVKHSSPSYLQKTLHDDST